MDTKDDSSWAIARRLPSLPPTSLLSNLTIAVIPRSPREFNNQLVGEEIIRASTSYLYLPSESFTIFISTLCHRTKVLSTSQPPYPSLFTATGHKPRRIKKKPTRNMATLSAFPQTRFCSSTLQLKPISTDIGKAVRSYQRIRLFTMKCSLTGRP